ncbi:pilus assembly protein PilZ [Shewanella mangrovi]|uniref:Pilus assembly protein PilZ n=1 Tax=Shewanella mangrovi TaxID=1515746 RepID=A0A094LVH8_9GAMM|nr:PilZ domain-containing protein [Shewanella mangrovi]KFZ39228.1 pilus assembly protein PilZ [Shewanella mangrovi]
MSPEAHASLIEQLKPMMMEPNFDDIFTRLTAKESNSTRFLLKMEINRLASPCLRIIDLRDKSDQACTEVTVAGQRHFLDEAGKQDFETALALYRNQYTMGVYEHVMNMHNERKRRQRSLQNELDEGEDSFKVRGIILGNYIRRTEERMNYSIKILVSQPGRREVAGSTIDLSVGGARIKLPANHNLNLSQPLLIKLIELSDEYYFADLQQGVEYQVADAVTKDDDCVLRLKRSGGSEQLSEMLANLIRGFKFRYKVDINDVLVNASGMGFERHYLPHFPHLPVFIERNEQGQYHASTILLSRDNQSLLHHFVDEKEINQLPAILDAQRLAALIDAPEDSPHALLFSFTYQSQGRIFFYCATLAELQQQPSLLPLFLGFGAQKASWRVYRLYVNSIDHSQSYKASILPGDDQNYAALTEQQLSRYTHIVQLYDCTSKTGQSRYQAWQYSTTANELKRFGLKKLDYQAIRPIAMQFSERRQEPRYSFKTSVMISQNGAAYTGVTQDISSRGLQLNFAQPVTLDPKQEIVLSFPKLQELSPKSKLRELPYRLVKSRKNGMTQHLSAVIGHDVHTGVEFLNRLIIHNRAKLDQLSEHNVEIKELADALKNQLMRHLRSVPYMLEKTSKSYRVACIGIGMTRDPISDRFACDREQKLQFELSPLLANGHLKQDIINPIKEMKPQQNSNFTEIFAVSVGPKNNSKLVRCQYIDSFSSALEEVRYIKQADDIGEFVAFRIYRAATGKPDLSYLQRELEYIRLHAMHREKQLESLLWRIAGVGEIADVSLEVRWRYPELHQLAE